MHPSQFSAGDRELMIEITDPSGGVSLRPLTPSGLSIGRADDNDLSLLSSSLSRHHARIELDESRVPSVCDLGSKNGVYLNGERVAAHVPCSFVPGDRLEICGFALRLVASSERVIDDDAPLDSTLTIDVLGAAEIRNQLCRVTRHDRAFDLAEGVQMEDLLSAAIDLMSTHELAQVRESILDFAQRIVGFDAGYILSWPQDAERPLIEAARHHGRAGSEPIISRTIVRNAIAGRKPVLVLDPRHDERYEAAQSIIGMGIRSAVAVPITADDGSVLAVLYISRLGDGPVFGEHDARVLHYAGAVAGLRYQNARLTEDSLRRRFLEGELSVAATIQRDLLPMSAAEVPGYEIIAGYQPCHETSGDFYDHVVLHDKRLAFSLGDVSGKGVGAAMLMFSVVTVLRTLLRELGRGRDLPGLLTRANEALSATMASGRFATACAGVLDPATGNLAYSNAGQAGRVVRRRGESEAVRYHGTPLGLLEGCDYGVAHTNLERGDLFVLYSDGITEARRFGEYFGETRIIELACELKDAPAAAFAERLQDELVRFRGGAPSHDDVTFLVIKRL